MFRAAATSAILAAAVLAAPQLSQAEEVGRFERTLKVSGPVDLSVASGSGSINVVPAADGSVRVIGTLHANRWGSAARRRSSMGDLETRVRRIEAQPPIEQAGNTITIGKRARGDDDDLYDNISISYELYVPASTTLNANTGSGSVTVGALRGPVTASSGSGSVEIGATGGPVKATTGSGSIRVDGAKERVDAHSGSGSITLRNIAGSTTAHASSGSIDLEQTAAGLVQLTSSSGRIKAWGVRGGLKAHSSSGSISVQGTPTEPWDLNASSGSIHLNLPSDAAFTLRANTGSGSINVDHPVQVQGRIDRHSLQGTVRGGGPSITAHTASGSIDINASGAAPRGGQ
jgi:DUF4097 and DUF4098 domain-containing protein YvlB